MGRLGNKNNLVLCFTALCVGIGLLLPSSVGAQERQGLLLNANLLVESDSNITRTAEEISDKLAVFSPQLQFLSNVGQHTFVFDYRGDFAVYNEYNQYNHNDNALSLVAQFDHSYRINSEFRLVYENKIEAPGTTNAALQTNNEFNKYTLKSAFATFIYGTSNSSGQFVLGMGHNQQRYTNNQQSFRDLDLNILIGTFFYRMAPKTRLLLEASAVELDNISGIQISDSTSGENMYLAGVEWEATATSSGTFKVGYREKGFEGNRLNDLDGLSYLLDMVWQPSSYTKVNIGAKRQPEESALQNVGGYISNSYSLSLSHRFSTRSLLKATYRQKKSDFSSTQNRTGKSNTITMGVKHSLRTWLGISLDYRHSTRSSNDEIYTFSSKSVELSLTSKFD
jgi:hypothetical protein